MTTPVRKTLLSYGKQSIDESDVQAVADQLRSAWLTTGPTVGEFEKAFAAFTGAIEAVAVSNGTAALHAAVRALGITAGDEVIVPAMTFAASANAVLFEGGTPVFADVHADSLLIDPASVKKLITKKTKAIIAVDYAGQPCDYDALRTFGLPIIADACHALGGSLNKKPVGSLADLSTFSFHPVKPMTTGEGGMITTDDSEKAATMRAFRNHCLTSDHRERETTGAWKYDVTNLGYNYRLTDLQCALGLSQLKKLPQWVTRRQEIAKQYDQAFAGHACVTPLTVRSGVSHGYHLYVIQLHLEKLTKDRNEIFKALRAENIGVNVHYTPVHLLSHYRTTLGTKEGMCPNAEHAFQRILTLPLFPAMTDADVRDVVTAIDKVTAQ
jgi:perosamine synthetase